MKSKRYSKQKKRNKTALLLYFVSLCQKVERTIWTWMGDVDYENVNAMNIYICIIVCL